MWGFAAAWSPATRFVASILLATVLGVGGTDAAESGAEKDAKYTLSEKTYKALSEAQELMTANKHREALSRLEAILPTVSGDAYAAAVTWQMLGYVYGNLDDYGRGLSGL